MGEGRWRAWRHPEPAVRQHLALPLEAQIVDEAAVERREGAEHGRARVSLERWQRASWAEESWWSQSNMRASASPAHGGAMLTTFQEVDMSGAIAMRKQSPAFCVCFCLSFLFCFDTREQAAAAFLVCSICAKPSLTPWIFSNRCLFLSSREDL